LPHGCVDKPPYKNNSLWILSCESIPSTTQSLPLLLNFRELSQPVSREEALEDVHAPHCSLDCPYTYISDAWLGLLSLATLGSVHLPRSDQWRLLKHLPLGHGLNLPMGFMKPGLSTQSVILTSATLGLLRLQQTLHATEGDLLPSSMEYTMFLMRRPPLWLRPNCTVRCRADSSTLEELPLCLLACRLVERRKSKESSMALKEELIQSYRHISVSLSRYLQWYPVSSKTSRSLY
jgi:hypothetical protein